MRFPKGTVAEPITAVRTVGTVDVLAEPDDGEVDVLLVGIGSMAATALTAAEKLTAEGRAGACRRPRVGASGESTDLVAPGHRPCAASRSSRTTSSSVASARRWRWPCATPAPTCPLDSLGIPKRFLHHGSRGQVLDGVGLTPEAIAATVRTRLG